MKNTINSNMKPIKEVMQTKAELGMPSGTPDKNTYCNEEKNVMIINE